MKQLNISTFFRNNGFKLALIFIVFVIVLFKDLNFQINLRAPEFSQNQMEEGPSPTLVHNKDAKANRSSSPEARPPADQFDLNPLRNIAHTPSEASILETKELPAINTAEKQAFVKRFAHVAVIEKSKYGVPASLILANAILISRVGKTDLSERGNNFFALPCTADWRGQRLTPGNTCYRAYENAWTSFRDNSIYLSQGKFASLRTLENDDYRGWAKALGAAGYYPEGVNADMVIREIEGQRLYLHDR